MVLIRSLGLHLLGVTLLAPLTNALTLSVASSGGNASSPLAYGLMFEDINHSGDGGLYAELIQNRASQGSTEYPSNLTGWSGIGGAVLTLQNTSVALSSSLRTSVNVKSSSTSGSIGLQNSGWWGISVKPQTYTGSFWVLGTYAGNYTIKLQGTSGTVYASAEVPSAQTKKWAQYKFTLQPTVAAPDTKNVFILEYDAGSSLNFNLISLFPPTYNNRPNGLRPELMQALKGLNPSFLRAPGGNNIEGDTFHYPWRWNETIGPLTQRPGRPGTWTYENTDGLGLIEYLQWCDDLNMEPILAVWSGQYLNGYITPPDVIPEADLGPYVQDTLNELEFIMGDTSTTYGALRASMGYPTPWKINYVEIGNEDFFAAGKPSYTTYRFKAYYNAIIAAYPHMVIISSTGDSSAQIGHSATDWHEYTKPDTFVSQFNRFDHRVSTGNLLLIGEYANIHSNANARLKFPSWIGSVAETVFSLGAERNSYGILGMSYAPLLQNINSVQWGPDLITFNADPSSTVLSTSYHCISLISTARYTSTVPVTMHSSDTYGPAYWVAGTSGAGKYTFKAAVYNSTAPVPFNITFEGLAKGAKASLTVLTGSSALGSNTIGAKEVVSKSVTTLTVGSGGTVGFELPDLSVAVLTT